MLIQHILEANLSTPEAYRARLRALRPLLVVLKILGAATVLFALLGVPRLLPEGRNASFFSGFYSGTGFFLMVFSAVLFIRIGRILRDDTALRREFTRATDERNRCIRQKAAQSAAVVLFLLLYIVLLAAGLFAPVLFLFCLAGILAFAALYLIFYLYYNRVL